MDIAEYLRLFRRRWITVLAGIVLGVLVAFVVALTLPASYQAKALLFLSVRSDDTSLFERSQFSVQRIESYPELASTPAVLDPVIEQLDLHLTADQLARRVTVVNPPGTVFLTVSAEDGRPSIAARLANAVSSSLIAQVSQLEQISTDATDHVSLTIATPADAPTTPSSPPRVILLGLGLLAGLVVGLIAAIVRSRRRWSLESPESVEALVGAPVLGMVSPSDRRAGSSELRDVRTRLLELGGGTLPAVLLAVPVVDRPAIGRVLRILARALAEGGRTACVIENGSGSASGRPGFAEVLGSALPPREALTDAGDGIQIMAAGDPAAAPPRRALGPRALVTLRQIRKLADVTVFASTESSVPLDLELAAPTADAVLVLVDARRDSAADIERTMAELRMREVRPLAALLIGRDG